ncbi:copper resistance protein [Scheffersomyces stipitis CBS 6054]|uniref:Copper resistance protein n=1 Tax=Scheffersomyces stipitis (strain ATCC 58785 / CBS 6054 / NBRC 10063 / NRRL Y-11545) TaxID=322104 RepID=A3GI49_PICST|nr:copper resistance protein [Scheffersomyces stipitis CBS 6054]EAZ62926.2 copper resistance protein [Scheffersomyces stipitis CBS 6054]
MVLINGVKYACERCIRGHRVTTCTHTDQPLTMIKPKGRPASQCQHCRDQRKMKNLHTTCTCGKKGKSPGMHLASCPCHKNSHCTCSANQAAKKVGVAPQGNIHHQTASERAKKKSLITAANADLLKRSASTSSNSNLNSNSSNGNPSTSPRSSNGTSSTFTASNSLNNYVIEDVIVPFETSNGLFDLFSSAAPSENNTSNNSINGSKTNLNDPFNTGSNSNSAGSLSPSSNFNNNNNTTMNGTNSISLSNNNYNDLSYDTNNDTAYEKDSIDLPTLATDIKRHYNNPDIDAHLSPTELELVDHMFPLFPLVGTASFDSDSNQPLSSIPQNNIFTSLHEKSAPMSTTFTNLTGTNGNGNSKVNPLVNSNGSNNSNANVTNTNADSNVSTDLSHSSSIKSLNRPHQPKPVRPIPQPSATPQSTSSNVNSTNSGNNHYQPIRPKRPESVLSIASNSSSRSFDVNHNHNSSFIVGGIPNSTNSAAYPPSGLYGAYDVHNVASGFHSDDSPHYHHFGGTGLGSTSSSTNIASNQNESDFANSENWFSELASNNNKRTTSLSTSSSFANIYENQKNGLSEDRKVSGTPDVSNGDIYGNSKLTSAVPEENGEEQNYSSSVPPAQAPMDYEVNLPMFQDLLPSFDGKSFDQDF